MRLPLKSTLLAAFALLFPLQGFSAKPQGRELEYEGVDIRPLVEGVRGFIVTLDRPVTVFNWSTRGMMADRPDAFQSARSIADVYWERYARSSQGSYFGDGLYTALDPVASNGYGNAQSDWLLTEFKLPVGFRLLDFLKIPEQLSLPNKARGVLRAFECDPDLKVQLVFWESGAFLKPKCSNLVRHLFRDVFAIDGFSYEFAAAKFKACENPQYEGGRAILITSSRWMLPDLVSYYNSRTRDRREKRILLQSMFFDDLRRARADQEVVSSSFTSAEARSLSRGFLLWEDLEGEPKVDTSAWLKENHFGCAGLPYRQNP